VIPVSYVVIARKYRPQGFGEMIGQEAVATTLKNAIALGRVAHAYLFAGPRGVGKTSMARIFSKALNCRNGPTPDPCGTCSSCAEIAEGRALDVIEIDGASNRGIEDVRSIRESIRFAPASGRFKIYIIDEVHQITPDGFNALLKTLEEPPLRAKFIFATTAPHKIPPTVLSRCQRFDFRRIPTGVIADALAGIARKEGLRVDAAALREIAKASDGSLRDAQSILDQMASFSRGEISFAQVSDALGSVRPEEITGLFGAVARKDGAAVLGFVDRAMAEGREPGLVLERLVEHVRNLLVVKIAPEPGGLVEGSDAYAESLAAQAKHFSKDDLFYIYSLLVQGLQNARRFGTKRIALEFALLKAADREPMAAPGELPADGDAVPAPEPSRPRSVGAEAAPEAAPPALPAGLPPEALWEDFLRRVRAEKMSAWTYLAGAAPVAVRGDCVVIGFPPDLAFNAEALQSEANRSLLEKHLSELLQRRARVEIRIEKSAPAAAAVAPEPGIVKTALGIFGGRVVKS
jgi:DNA polymerase-3 subunit gamma/tau